jgi:predicted Zn-dependent protease
MKASTRRGVALLLAASFASGCAPLTVQEEKQLGREAQRSIREQMTFVRDPVTVRYVRDMGARLVDAAPPSPFEFRFYVIEDEELNAFAVPGGAVYVHTGLIQAVNDAAELAGVLAHEIGHVTSRHVAKMARTGRNTSIMQQVATVIIAILTGSQVAAQGADLATGVAAQAYMSTFTQDAEREADGQAIDTMIRAGFDPNGIVTMFETLREEAKGSSRPPQFLSSHPAPTERILSAQAAIRAREPLSGLRRDDGGKLEIIQERLRLIIGIDVEELLEDDDDE